MPEAQHGVGVLGTHQCQPASSGHSVSTVLLLCMVAALWSDIVSVMEFIGFVLTVCSVVSCPV